jgi:hypothetical protein
VKAYAWASLAADTGLKPAIEARRLIGNYLTVNQLANAQRLSAQLSHP